MLVSYIIKPFKENKQDLKMDELVLWLCTSHSLCSPRKKDCLTTPTRQAHLWCAQQNNNGMCSEGLRSGDTVTTHCAFTVFTHKERVGLNTSTWTHPREPIYSFSSQKTSAGLNSVSLAFLLSETQVQELNPTTRPSHHFSECHLYAHWRWNIYRGGRCSDAHEPGLLKKAWEL